MSLSTVEEQEEGDEEMKEGQEKKKLKEQFIGGTVLSNFRTKGRFKVKLMDHGALKTHLLE